MIFRKLFSGQIFAVMLLQVEMAISNVIFNQTKKLMFIIYDILTFTILNN